MMNPEMKQTMNTEIKEMKKKFRTVMSSMPARKKFEENMMRLMMMEEMINPPQMMEGEHKQNQSNGSHSA